MTNTLNTIAEISNHISLDRCFTLINGLDSMNEQKSHKQTNYEIQYIVSGQGYIYINDKKLFLSVGDYVILTPDDQHSLKIKDSIRFFSLEFSVQNSFAEHQLHDELKKLFFRQKNEPVVSFKNIALKPLFDALFQEWQERKPMYIYQISLLFQQILLLCCRNYRSMLLIDKLDRSEDEKILDTFSSFVEAYMSDPDVLALFEKNYGVKRTTLSHLTKQKYGKTAFQLYNDKRFEYALGLLIEGRNTITDIAQKCAFSSVASFSKAFTQYFGMSPSRYLQTHVSQNTDERHIDIYADFSTCAFWHSGAEFSEKYFQTTSNTTEYQNPKLNLI